MPTFRFIHLSTLHILDVQDCRFYSLIEKRPAGLVATPAIYSEYADSEGHKRVSSIELKDLSVKLSRSYKNAAFSFYDRAKDKKHDVTVRVVPCKGILAGVRNALVFNYSFIIDGNPVNHQSQVRDIGAFSGVYGISRIHMLSGYQESLSYGVPPTQLSVSYKDRPFGGKCYALVCGTWGILLGDDFSFDALVTFSGYNNKHLDVDRVVYTTNTYISKFVVLGG